MATTSQITFLLENDVQSDLQYGHTDPNMDLSPFLHDVLSRNSSPTLDLLLGNDESTNISEETSNFAKPIFSQSVDPFFPSQTEIDNTNFLLAPLLDGLPELTKFCDQDRTILIFCKILKLRGHLAQKSNISTKFRYIQVG